MQSKNSLCECGSGEKFKRCCMVAKNSLINHKTGNIIKELSSKIDIYQKTERIKELFTVGVRTEKLKKMIVLDVLDKVKINEAGDVVPITEETIESLARRYKKDNKYKQASS